MSTNKFSYLLDNLSGNNCNYRIDKLSEIQSNISSQYTLVYDGKLSRSIESLDQEYDLTCDIMDSLCKFRRNHKCAIQGDPKYSMS
jgi:hypothetical protein